MKQNHSGKKGRISYAASFFLVLSLILVIGIPVIFALHYLNRRPADAASETNPASSSTEEASGSFSEEEPVGQESSEQTSSGDSSEQESFEASSGQNSSEEELSEEELLRSQALSLLHSMTLKEKVGQMFFIRCPSENAAELAAEWQPGGYVLFASDFENKTPDEAAADIQSCQDSVRIPMLIGVDEEGGTVTRISRFSQYRDEPFLSPRDLYAEGGWDLIRSDTIEKCALLRGLGINVNLAPVCDVSTGSDDFIYERAFSNDAQEAAEYVSLVVSVMNDEGMGCTLKHFPGYGNNVDTHTGIAVDRRSLESFYENDFLPFIAGIEAGAGSILVSHNIMTCVDDSMPASLSPAVHELLREDLDFDGVIMTDDLIMDAITQYTDGSSAAVLAVLAGNDLLICSDPTVQLPAVIEAVKEGTISLEQVEESVLRILMWKLELNIIS